MKKLIQVSPPNIKKVFLCNSGAETIEAAIKFARHTTRKGEFICTFNGFHGRTMGALSATFNPKYRAAFEPLIPGFNFVAFNNFDQIRNKTTLDTAAIILEIIQGEGGVNVGDHQYFKKVSQWCQKNKILLIIDEVQTGFCRTGKMFASDFHNLQPDILCVAKAIAGGLPMGAVLCSETIKPPKGQHGSTFGGNPLACAAALAAIDFMIDNNLAEQALQKGKYLMNRIKSSPIKIIKEIRGLGLMIGVELTTRVKPYILKLAERGILVLPAGKKVLRLLPPLTISYQEIGVVVEKIIQVLKE
jgi:acetylornithine/LysW-gamma-L-lysine aminotransferase